MAFTHALKAYENSKLRHVRYEMEGEIYGRSHPLGGIVPGFKQMGNSLARLPKMAWAEIRRSGGPDYTPTLPDMPEAFKGTHIEQAFQGSLEHKKEKVQHDVAGMKTLLSFDIPGWYAHEHVADFNQKRDQIVLPQTTSTLGAVGAIATSLGARMLARGLRDYGVHYVHDLASPAEKLSPALPALGQGFAAVGNRVMTVC